MAFLWTWVHRTVRSVPGFQGSQRCTDPLRLIALRRIVSRVPNRSLLDLGCGVGDLSGMTRARDTGVDRCAGYVIRVIRYAAHLAAPPRAWAPGR